MAGSRFLQFLKLNSVGCAGMPRNNRSATMRWAALVELLSSAQDEEPFSDVQAVSQGFQL